MQMVEVISGGRSRRVSMRIGPEPSGWSISSSLTLKHPQSSRRAIPANTCLYMDVLWLIGRLAQALVYVQSQLPRLGTTHPFDGAQDRAQLPLVLAGGFHDAAHERQKGRVPAEGNASENGHAGLRFLGSV